MSEGFLGELADTVGYPFNQIPPEAFIHGAAGYGQATLCGSLGVAAACIGMVTDADTQREMVGELFNWYKEFPFPEYQPEGLNLPTTVAESLLCADSVGKFMEVHGVDMAHPERKSRCAGVAAGIAGKITEMLNEHFA
ncbi:MAG TPA: C-GCAxxG-C-C family protein [Oscillospiraceae bacterium]|nr:C-GCAxxG-C-C family protein [Oscillospiraceae bacterium]